MNELSYPPRHWIEKSVKTQRLQPVSVMVQRVFARLEHGQQADRPTLNNTELATAILADSPLYLAQKSIDRYQNGAWAFLTKNQLNDALRLLSPLTLMTSQTPIPPPALKLRLFGAFMKAELEVAAIYLYDLLERDHRALHDPTIELIYLSLCRQIGFCDHP
ncbi:hypothetical protein ACFLZY_00660 [Patescibacteria group bacterium]